MPELILLSPESLAGKTTVAAGLGDSLRLQNRAYTLTRLPGDDHADVDSGLFAAHSLRSESSGTDAVTIIEASAGDPADALSSHPDIRALVIADASKPLPGILEYCRAAGDRVAGLILNKAPAKRIATIRKDAESAGVNLLALVPEDRLLAAPILGDVALALSASIEHFADGTGFRPLDRPVIATISADPGQAHFAHYDASAVIVRSDKPDLQLAALNAGATCLIVTGGLPILSYVLDRAEEDEIPLLRTGLDTVATVTAIEEMFGNRPFSGGEEKMRRLASLLSEVDPASLAG